MRTLFRASWVSVMVVVFAIATLAQQTTNAPATPAPTPTQKPAAASTGQDSKQPKPKKVWTEDEVGKLNGPVSVVGSEKSNHESAESSESRGHEANAATLRTQLAKLQAQLDDADHKIAQLKNIQSGATSGDSELQLHHGYNMESLPDQIKKLEEKKKDIQNQMDEIYEQARKNGIEPGQLR